MPEKIAVPYGAYGAFETEIRFYSPGPTVGEKYKVQRTREVVKVLSKELRGGWQWCILTRHVGGPPVNLDSYDRLYIVEEKKEADVNHALDVAHAKDAADAIEPTPDEKFTEETKIALDKAAVVENPKYVQAQKDGKAPLELLLPVAMEAEAWALKNGADKYGRRNWRESRISASTYIGAIRRHVDAWQEGEDRAEDSGVSHLGHVMACCAIVLDSIECGTFEDDRDDVEVKGDDDVKA